jgi:putative endonuclease
VLEKWTMFLHLHDGQCFPARTVHRRLRIALRVWEHKNNLGGYFTKTYKCHRLVYFEEFGNIEVAFLREDQIKGWRREKKNRLVETLNPEWKDLAADWYPDGLLLDEEPFPKKK